MVEPKTYTISGRQFVWGEVSWGQFERLAPLLPRLVTSLQGVANPMDALGTLGPILTDLFQALVGPELDVRTLPADPIHLIPAVFEVITSSGLIANTPGAAPPGGAKAGKAKARPSRRKA